MCKSRFFLEKKVILGQRGTGTDGEAAAVLCEVRWERYALKRDLLTGVDFITNGSVRKVGEIRNNSRVDFSS